MKRFLLIITVYFSFFTLCNCQEKQTYWKITSIYKEDKKPLRGVNLAIMEAIYYTNPHFKKNGQICEYDFPQHRIVAIDTMSSLGGERYPDDFFVEKYRGLLQDSIYFIGIEDGKFKIKFINSNTGDDDNRTVIAFEELSEEKYYESLQQAKDKREKQKQETDSLIRDFKKNHRFEYNKQETQSHVFEDLLDTGKDLKFVYPTTLNITYSRGLFGDKFDKLKIGASAAKDIIYDVETKEYSFGLKPRVIISTEDKDKFVFDRYIKSIDQQTILYQDSNSFVSINTSYDEEEEKPRLSSITLFKYFYHNGFHIIFSGEIYKSKIETELDTYFQFMSNFKIIEK